MSETVMMKWSAIARSKTNPRKTFDKLTELAESLQEFGMLQELLVREKLDAKKGTTHELVIGERRYRAAKIAGIEEVPVKIRVLNDREVEEIQNVENAQREDVPPLEEAASYVRLIALDLNIGQIAGKVGKSASYVAQRMRLADLIGSARVALENGQIYLGVAEQIARLAAPAQERVLEEAMRGSNTMSRFDDGGDEGSPELMTASEVRNYIRAEFMLKLKLAPFDVSDPTLVPMAGSCTACPKRTGRQQDLFSDVADGDTCTDVDCFRKKSDTSFNTRAAAAPESVLTPAETEKAFSSGYIRHDARFVDLDALAGYRKSERVTWRELVGEEGPPILLARLPGRGKDAPPIFKELVRKADLSAVKPAEKWAKDAIAEQAPTSEQKREKRATSPDTKYRNEAIVRGRANAKLIELVIAAASKKAVTDSAIRLVLNREIDGVWAEVAKRVCARRGLDPKVVKNDYGSALGRGKALREAAAKLKGGELFAMLLELMLSKDFDVLGEEIGAHYGIDAKAVREREKAAFVAAQKAKKKMPIKAAKKKPKAKKKGAS